MNVQKLPYATVLLLRSLFSALILYSTVLLHGQVPKMVIVEEFTNASCPPCASQNPAFIQLLKQNTANVIPIKYQTQFPGYDPYNAQNLSDVMTMQTLHDISGVPTALIDGKLPDANYGGGGLGNWGPGSWYPGAPGGFTQEALDFATAQQTSIEVSIDVDWNSGLSEAEVTVRITNHGDDPIEGQYPIRIFLLEVENHWPFPPGTTNEVEFTHVMRKAYPANGPSVLNFLAPGATHTLTITAAIPDYIYDLKEMVFACYIHNIKDLQILNGAISEKAPVSDQYSDMAIVEKTTLFYGEECGRTAKIGMVAANTGQTFIYSFEGKIIAGNEVHTYTYDGELKPGDSVYVEFEDPIILPSGNFEVSYALENINGGVLREINLLNNIVKNDAFSAIAIRPMSAFESGFEEDKAGAILTDQVRLVSPNNLFVRVSDKTLFSNIETEIGGYAESEKSIFVNFRQWNTASFAKKGSILFLDNVDISESPNIRIIFDKAHAQRDKSGSLSNDALEAYISLDCGKTWALTYRKSGAELATTTPVADRFFPAASDWNRDTIFLSDLEAETLMFKFELGSDHGNSLFLDNFYVESVPVNTREYEVKNEKLVVYPNPGIDFVNIQFSLDKSASVTTEVYSIGGRMLHVLTNDQIFEAGTHQLKWEATHSGLFFIRMWDGKDLKTQLFSVAK